MICRNCFHVCDTLNTYRSHQVYCYDHDSVLIQMPHNYESSVRFKNFNARCFTPFVIYFDLESLLVPVQTAHNDPTKSSTTVIEQHTPCSYCIVVVEIDKQEPKFVELYRGVDAMERFIKTIERLAKQIHELKRTHVTFTGTNVTPRETADVCWICEQPFVDSVKVLDHCHFSNKFLGWAHIVQNVICSEEHRTLHQCLLTTCKIMIFTM